WSGLMELSGLTDTDIFDHLLRGPPGCPRCGRAGFCHRLVLGPTPAFCLLPRRHAPCAPCYRPTPAAFLHSEARAFKAPGFHYHIPLTSGPLMAGPCG